MWNDFSCYSLEQAVEDALGSWRARQSVAPSYWAHAGWCSHLGLLETRQFVMKIEDDVYMLPRTKRLKDAK